LKNLLVDENISHGLIDKLRSLGWKVISVAEAAKSFPDERIFAKAIREHAILITRDYNFTNPVRFNTKKTEGIVYIRQGNLTVAEETAIVTAFLSTTKLEIIKGRLVTLYRDRVNIR
jgi:predicted nuclease of predicted toxin-antitoxin system